MPCKKWIDVWTIMNRLSFVPLTCSEICLLLLLMEREAIIHFFLWLPTLLQLMCQEVNGPPGILCIKQFSIIAAQGNMTLFSQKCIEICAFYMSHNVWYEVRCGLLCLMIHHIVRMVMMTSSNGNIFRITGHLCGEFNSPWWIHRTKASDAELWCFLWSGSE